MRSRSFAVRLGLAFAAVAVAGAALTAVAVNLGFGARFTGYLERQQQAREVELVAALADAYRRTGGWNPTDLEPVAALALADGGTLTLLDPAGRVVWPTATDRRDGEGNAAHQDGTGHGGMGHGMAGPVLLGAERRLPVRVDGAVVATAVLRLPATGALPADRTFRAAINRLLLAGGLGAGLLALALGLLLARRATAPARALTRTATALATGDRTRRVQVRTDDEFGQMARAFNRMADHLETEDRLRRDFAAAVAHELRTPLAILRSQIEAMQDGVVPTDPSALASLHEEVLRTGRLVDDLQALAAAEAAGFSLERQPVPLRPLLEEVIRELAGPFAAEGVRLDARLANVVVSGDPTRLRQVVTNLLSNALKFTPQQGVVRVELTGEDGQVVLGVADSGPGIPAEELPLVFDRFFRGRHARAGGSGIGLAVVRELVGAHGGQVQAASPPGHGATFTVRLPAAPPAQRSFTAPSPPPATVGAKGGDQR